MWEGSGFLPIPLKLKSTQESCQLPKWGNSCTTLGNFSKLISTIRSTFLHSREGGWKETHGIPFKWSIKIMNFVIAVTEPSSHLSYTIKIKPSTWTTRNKSLNEYLSEVKMSAYILLLGNRWHLHSFVSVKLTLPKENISLIYEPNKVKYYCNFWKHCWYMIFL